MTRRAAYLNVLTKGLKMYSLTAYPTSGFPKFMDSYKTLTQIRKVAADLIKDGYAMIEIKKDQKMPSGYFGIQRDLIETIHA